VRVTTAFNKILSIRSATVASVEFTPEGVVVGLRRRRGRPRCPCGRRATEVYDSSVRRWRHLDLGASKLWLRAEIRRLHCRRCGRVRTEEVPWARPRARHTRDFEDVVAWLAQRTDKTTITRLMRTSWETVAGNVERVVAEQIDTRRPTELLRLGVDEVSYRKGHRFLTVVADHDQSGRVVWAAEGKNAATLEAFYDQLGEAGCAQLQAVSMDLGAAFKRATDHSETRPRSPAVISGTVRVAPRGASSRRYGVSPATAGCDGGSPSILQKRAEDLRDLPSSRGSVGVKIAVDGGDRPRSAGVSARFAEAPGGWGGCLSQREGMGFESTTPLAPANRIPVVFVTWVCLLAHELVVHDQLAVTRQTR
jgi:hypothetical protein